MREADLPRGDLDRVHRHQELLNALLAKSVSGGFLTSLTRSFHLVSAVTKSLAVDDTLSNWGLAKTAFGLRNLSTSNSTFMTAPVSGFGTKQGQSVTFLDRHLSPKLWRAVNHQQVLDYLNRYGGDTLPTNPR